MAEATETVLVTGVAGNLGVRLLPLLSGFRIIGVDVQEPRTDVPLEFLRIDLGSESSCEQLVKVLRERRVNCVVHLAFIIDPVRSNVLDPDLMWRINVAGTARVMEAIAEVNRRRAYTVQKFIFPSSVSAYGPDLPGAVKEDCPLSGHTLHYAIHKRESDLVVQSRARHIENCHTFLLRPHIFMGASMQNYLVGALRGLPTGRGRLADKLRERGTRMPILLPRGQRYLENRIQFVHVDDMARLIAHILRRRVPGPGLTVLNVAGRGETLTVADCARIANAKIVQLPTRMLVRIVLRVMWKLGISGFPPEAFPYLAGSYTMDTTRLREFLGPEYERIIQHTSAEALADSFQPAPASPEPVAEPEGSRA
jgi:nucleoside-diphosphate-sugar epimerase